MTSEQREAGMILIVDDTPANLNVLLDYLTAKHFKVSISTSGEQALKRLERIQPDLILLDVMMAPGIDGFEVCRRLKAAEATRDIPIIFMTALSETINKVRGFELGAADYVTKPFQHEEVLARVRAHITIRHQQQALEESNATLQQLLREKQELFDIVSHDLKNPLQVIAGYTDMLTFDASPSRKYAKHIEKASQRMLHLINNLVESNRMDSGQRSLTYECADAREMILEILEQYHQKAESRHIRFDVALPEGQCRVFVDRHAMLEILDNLISNAIKYSPDRTIVTIRVTHTARHVQCAVQDQGQGFAPEEVGMLFRKFSRLSAIPARGESSTGLGLFIVKTLVEAMRGDVRAESPGTNQGSIFTVTLPKADDTDE